MPEEEEKEPVEKKKTLWILACENGIGLWIEVFPLYATSEEDAELQAQILLVQETAKRPLVRFCLKPFPEGFIMGRRKMQGRIYR